MTKKITKGRSEPNLMPSKTVQRDYLRQVRQAADAGDTTAMVGMLILAKMDAHKADQIKAALKQRMDSISINDDLGGYMKAFKDYLFFAMEEDEKNKE